MERTAELTLWREATNFFACEPFGLGVATSRRWPDAGVTIVLDTTEPVMLGSFTEEERGWRSALQRASREEAASLGIPIDGDRISLSEIREALSSGESVLLLITLDAMLGIDVPHWVLCHGTVPGAVVIEDPWVSDNIGETWVDSHLLPVHDYALDEMSLIDGARYRGAVRIGSSS
ncbi:peptidase C39 family protein [Rhodococcus artemisiae]|uniref:Peptidase C39 family protein n=1 Tax=Rhodococcus artemisiae TaxID=714159 RepID=A0ABU7LHL7_9NOCA|nr:peptidase C39 family protein [Rhodococcus artemisiae]MEE2060742.1 peptidase C39 family protein [Rhodococcus artemisiae]